MAKGKPAPVLSLFGFEEPELDITSLTSAGAELAEAAERSRALREDLVFPAEEPNEGSILRKAHSCPNCDGQGVLTDFGVETCEVCRGSKALTDAELAAFASCVNVEKAADSFALARLEDQWPHAYAFVAQARKHGQADPALTPVKVSPAGRREFDMAELARYANELLRGVRSDRPGMTPERWAQATAKVREIGGKS